MDEIVGMCGLICSDCPAYIATVEDDDTKRAATAKLWSEQYGVEVEAVTIDCLGCHASDDSVFTHPLKCAIRLCGKKRGVATCAHCEDYPCETLEEFFEMAPDVRAILDAIRDSL